MWRGRLGMIGVLAGVALVGAVAWVVGLQGLANRAESVCLADLDDRDGYGGYDISIGSWPPSFECSLVGFGVQPLVVAHPVEAIVRFGWVVGTPVLSGTALLILSGRRRRPRAVGA